MPNSFFQFKQFRIDQSQAGMKVTTDACLFGAWVAAEIKNRSSNEPRNILDIGTGTGILSLMLAQVTDDSLIDAIELNQAAAAEAQENFKKAKWSRRLQVHSIAIQQFETSNTYDFIISNPPFFKDNQLGLKVTKNEAIHDVLLPMHDLAKHIKRLLAQNGICYILYPENEMNRFIPLAAEHGLQLRRQVSVHNEAAKPCFRVMAAFATSKEKVVETEISIRMRDGKYTNEFWRLLSDYYLEYNNPENSEIA